MHGAQRHVHRRAARHDDRGGIAVIERLDQDHLVAGVDQGLHRGEDALGSAVSHDDVGLRIQFAVKERAVQIGQRLHQIGLPGAAGVLVQVRGDGLLRRLFDEVGRGEVGKALAEIDGVVPVRQSRKLGKHGRAEAADPLCGPK